ncbi:hypothetical protein DFH28DRAFT_961537 [Melampsora americana]|nr:hypothetical protein DFH28DRAFT_961537 [Melampsora americana]
MPGGTQLILTLQCVFNAIAFISVILIAAMLLAIFWSKKKRHPIILGFLITSWLAAWVALLPFFGSVWDYCLERPVNYANVPPGPVRTICNVNAVLLAYLWTAIPGYSFVFASEILRLLIEFWRLTKKGHHITITFKLEIESEDDLAGSIHESIASSQRTRRLDSQPAAVWHERNKQRLAAVIPLFTALPAVYIVIYHQVLVKWRFVNANQFGCRVPNSKAANVRAMILLMHLGTACVIGAIALITYGVIRIKVMSHLQRNLHYGLLIRLLLMSLLTGIGAELEWAVTYEPALRPSSVYVTPMYLITFPLLSALIFIDESILEEWKSWIKYPFKKGPIIES